MGKKSHASISMSIDGRQFHEEGEPIEVYRKFQAFLDEAISRAGQALHRAPKRRRLKAAAPTEN